MDDLPNHQRFWPVVRRTIGFLIIACAYLGLALTVLNTTETFTELFQNFGQALPWSTRFVIEHSHFIAITLLLCLYAYFVIFAATSWADIAERVYKKARNRSIVFLILVYTLVIVAYYLPIYNMGSPV